MRRPSRVATSAFLSTALAILTPSVVRAQQATVVASSRLDSLTARLVELELQRVTLSVSSVPSPGDPRDARNPDSQIATLHAQLRALPGGGAAEREATNRVVLALDARASTLRARLQELRLSYTEAHPAVRLAVGEARAIDQRLTDIRGAR